MNFDHARFVPRVARTVLARNTYGFVLLVVFVFSGDRNAFAQDTTAANQEAPATKQSARSPAPTFEDISYGPHERNKLDLWLAKSDKPTPMLIFIHGGGFTAGDKRGIRGKAAIADCLAAGVSFASINYRFREHAPIQEILRDAARAVQTIRSRAQEWNIDPDRIASFGGSAGAGTSLWLAFHDDLADPQATDPVLRQSSRLTAAGSLNGQATYDLREWPAVLGKTEFDRPASEWGAFYGFKSEEDGNTAAADKIMKDCSMLGLITKDDPPVAVACGMEDGKVTDRGHYLHHPKHSTAIADRCKENGIECLAVLVDQKPNDATKGKVAQQDRTSQQDEVVHFLIEKLKAPAKK